MAQDFVKATACLFGVQKSASHGSVAGLSSTGPAPVGDRWLLRVPLRVYSDVDERYVGGLVLTHGDDNAHGDIWEAKDIRILAHRFMEQSRHIECIHNTKVVAFPVEAFYFPTAEEGGQEEYAIYGETVSGGFCWLGSR